MDETNISQELMVRNGGDKWLTNVQVDVYFDGETYGTTFTDLITGETAKDRMSTSVSSSDVGKWQKLNDEIQVTSSFRQRDSDPEWYVPGSDFKFEVWTRTNDIY